MIKIIFPVLLNLFINQVLALSDTEGYFISHEDLIRNYQIESDYNKRDFLSYILTENPRVDVEEAVLITEEVIRISQCFKIDARLYLALMRMESNFERGAISHTGAVGLSQFTSIGAQEVNDQLGERGRDYANVRNTNYLNELINNCSSNWLHLWERAEGWQNQKRLFLEDIELSLIYGAILLKVYLAKNYEEDLRQNYYNALVNYNGEPGERKYWYARTILKFYDEI